MNPGKASCWYFYVNVGNLDTALPFLRLIGCGIENSSVEGVIVIILLDLIGSLSVVWRGTCLALAFMAPDLQKLLACRVLR
jgi:hypothetical protein